MGRDAPSYLAPYFTAAQKHAGGFRSLLWASTGTQEARLAAITRLLDMNGKSLLDVGCGRADLPAYLAHYGIELDSYIGLEAVPRKLVREAARRGAAIRNSKIIDADFVAEPRHLFVGSDVVIFSGSLNTLSDETFSTTLRHAYAAAGEHLALQLFCHPHFWRERRICIGGRTFTG